MELELWSEVSAAISAVAFVALGADARESSSGVNVNPPLCYLSGGAFVVRRKLRPHARSRPSGRQRKAP